MQRQLLPQRERVAEVVAVAVGIGDGPDPFRQGEDCDEVRVHPGQRHADRRDPHLPHRRHPRDNHRAARRRTVINNFLNL